MRILEMLIIGVIFIALVVRFLPRCRKRSIHNILPFVAGLLIPLHVIVEGYRWQMVPIYVFALGLIILSAIHLYFYPNNEYVINNSIARIVVPILTMSIFVFLILFPILLPIVDLPEPNGLYAVGTVSFRLTDNERHEIYTEHPNDSKIERFT